MIEPELFYKTHFCKAITGATDKELINLCIKVLDFTGNDITEKMEVFGKSKFNFNIKDLPINNIYEFFTKFRNWEEYIHPREQFPAHGQYWGLSYTQVELAYARKDEEKFKQAICDLIDKIIHD